MCGDQGARSWGGEIDGEGGRVVAQGDFVVGGDGVKEGHAGTDAQTLPRKVAGAQCVEKGVGLGA